MGGWHKTTTLFHITWVWFITSWYCLPTAQVWHSSNSVLKSKNCSHSVKKNQWLTAVSSFKLKKFVLPQNQDRRQDSVDYHIICSLYP